MAIDYKAAGVDKEAGYETVNLIKDMVKKTHDENVLTDLGGFAGLYGIGGFNYKNPVLVSGTDGVGTKVLIARELGINNTIGQDCVAMCVNDVLCQGAKPIFFLDYIGTGKVVPEKMASIVEGVAEGCSKAGCALIGGETAEMPGVYAKDDYDLAGFAVGIADKDKIITGEGIEAGDLLFGLKSSGVHSNGFSLVRKVLSDSGLKLTDKFMDKTLGEALLVPTKIYVKEMLGLMEKVEVKGMSHITGGGLYENVPRMLPKDTKARIDLKDFEIPEIFKLIEEKGKIEREEMFNTFNMGIGLVFVISPENKEVTVDYFKSIGEDLLELGAIEKGNREVELNY
ncbi:phosphoribosylformylglycinamidine cyclo-ligase [Lagierella sp.]|uniref:phosphoribosylformylglycinamidine cyclo-ligase n=1 Tax=Lagierella sp. TaxID=2849657 RepID=UPI00261F99A6|nr:phosphoribosylformylglycinamidine cyclo-ligase [Lagierella sp.]